MKFPGGKEIKDFVSRPIFWLIVIFLIVLTVRLIIAFSTPLLNNDAYFALRQAQNIKETGLPLYNDPLSYEGKTQLSAPLNYYVIAAFGLFMPIESAGKIVPNIFAAMLIFITYYLCMKITKNHRISIWMSIVAGFIPVYFIDLNAATVNYLAALLILSIIYCMLKLGERKYVDYALILMFLLVLTTPLAFVLVLGLLVYLLLLKLENYSIEMKELEIILFFTFLTFWVNLLIYKNAFLMHGLTVIWRNIPTDIISNTFASIGFISALAAISLVPIVLGVYAFYSAFHLDRNKDIMMLIGTGMSAFLLMWFKLIDLIEGLTVLSIILVILTAYSLKRIDEFIEKSKFQKYTKIFQAIIILLLILTIIPSIVSIMSSDRSGPYNTPSINDVKALLWAKENTPKNSVIMSSIDEGNIVAYYAQKKNVMDNNFLLTPRIDQRKADIDEVYTTKFETSAISILNKYKVKYILVTNRTMTEYGLTQIPPYLSDTNCFKLEYNRESTYLYRVDCKII